MKNIIVQINWYSVYIYDADHSAHLVRKVLYAPSHTNERPSQTTLKRVAQWYATLNHYTIVQTIAH